MATPDLVRLLREKAAAVSTVVVEVSDMQGALAYVTELCENKSPAVLLIEEAGTRTGEADPESGLPTRAEKVIAAPDLAAKDCSALKKICKEKGWRLVQSRLRNYVSGIDIGINMVEHAIAESGSCIVQSTNEDTLLCSGIAEISVFIVPKSGLLPDLNAAVPIMRKFMNKKTQTGGSYTSFVTSSSRTGDIEQVLTLGAHGPIEMHLILLGD